MTSKNGITVKLTGLAALMAALVWLVGCDATTTIVVPQPGENASDEEKQRLELVAKGREIADTCLGCHNIPSYTNAYPTYHVPKVWGQQADYIHNTVTAMQGSEPGALAAYTNGSRQHPTMRAQAHTLDDAERLAVAAFFSSYGHKVTIEDAKLLAEAEHQWQKSDIVKAWRTEQTKQQTELETLRKIKNEGGDVVAQREIVEAIKKPELTGQQLYVAATCNTCHGPAGMAQFSVNTEDGSVSASATPFRAVLAGQYKSFLKQALLEYRDHPLVLTDGLRKHPSMNGVANKLDETEIARIAEYLSAIEGSLATQAQAQ